MFKTEENAWHLKVQQWKKHQVKIMGEAVNT